jgi:hypothetical protein
MKKRQAADTDCIFDYMRACVQKNRLLSKSYEARASVIFIEAILSVLGASRESYQGCSSQNTDYQWVVGHCRKEKNKIWLKPRK